MKSQSNVVSSVVKSVVKERREYNTWVANETLEDYSLRYAPKSFRKWSEFFVVNTALGGISFLALEAIGGSLVINYGFTNSFWAIILVGIIIFITGLPIVYYAAKYNIDIDLLTRGAGFGYIGSTITSLIYASFTFIFFALEAAIMAQALQLYFHLPLVWGYLLCSLLIIPLVFYGITLISKLQLWSQGIWLLLMIAPYISIVYKEPDAISNWVHFAGTVSGSSGFNPLLFGTAATVSFSLIAQLGEQVDYLRFLPEKRQDNHWQWWLAVILAGPGWIIIGGAKQLGGAFLATLAIHHGLTIANAKQPIMMYLGGFADLFSNHELVLTIGTLFVIISQIKINVTNAYAGSLAWSNFFSRLTHSHPGRVVYLVFNVAIALLLMEMGVFETLETVLGLYSNVAIAWVGALVADLVINKPLGLSPSYIEFKRAYLYNFNPVGFGSMVIASIISILAFVGIFGPYPQAYAPFLALGIAFVLSPIIAIATKGKYYIARKNHQATTFDGKDLITCCVCEQDYEIPDTAYCPMYVGPICSLCCSLDARCHDRCKPDHQTLDQLLQELIQRNFSDKIHPLLGSRLTKFAEFFLLLSSVTAIVFGLSYYHKSFSGSPVSIFFLLELYVPLVVLMGIGCWLFVLSEESRQLAEAELDRQNSQLQDEITERKRAEIELEEAKKKADNANQAKSEFLANMSHELRTPLNGILGYAQILGRSKILPEKQLQEINVIHQCGSHLLTLINDILDISKIEARKLELAYNNIHLPSLLQGVVEISQIRAQQKNIDFSYEPDPNLPRGIIADEKRLRQVLINLLGNAIKFTDRGSVILKVEQLDSNNHQLFDPFDPFDHFDSALRLHPSTPLCPEVPPELLYHQGKLRVQSVNHQGKSQRLLSSTRLRFSVIDTGVGISNQDLQKLFRAFEQVGDRQRQAEGTGLGLAISQQIVKLMGGQIQVESKLGIGSKFFFEVELPLHDEWVQEKTIGAGNIISYKGEKKQILVVDDRWENRAVIVNLLEPLGFTVAEAENGVEGLARISSFSPDFIITDIGMPVMDGYEFARKIRQSYSEKIPMIACSASVSLADQNLAIKAGCNDFLSKPVEIKQLFLTLQKYLELEWVYEQSENSTEVQTFNQLEMIFPPAAELTQIYQSSRIGDIAKVKSEASRLEQLNQEYQPFIAHIMELANQFDDHAITLLLEPILQSR